MCGITGFYSPEAIFDQDDLVEMTRSLTHRGPDAEGFYFNENTGLGHRRLSIIDLSAAANQPMHSQCGRYIIVYNGEVYNYREIARELSCQLKTSSDTEVVLEAFAKWGHSFVKRLNGMFAIVIYDSVKQVIHAYRDRLGIKPFYYFWDGENFAFSSELKALCQIEYIRKNITLNKLSIARFLHLGYIPSPDSIYSNIYKLSPGYFLQLNGSNLKTNSYWKAENIIESNYNKPKNARAELTQLLESSVEYRMISDVPFGTFLSGGIDSSLITAIAQKLSPNPVSTFSIGFKDAKHDESEYSRKIADYLKTSHNQLIVTEKEAIELTEKLTNIYDEPFADSSSIPTLLLSQLTSQHVKMALSGDGGDELFWGYGAYTWAERLNSRWLRYFKEPVAYSLALLSNRYRRASYLFKYRHEDDITSHIFSQEQYLFSQAEVKMLLNPEYHASPAISGKNTEMNRGFIPSEKQAFFDLKYYLPDDLLTKVDRASMLHSLEVRVPLLDFRIVEFVLNLSPELKINGNVQKYLLKNILYDHIPENFFNRPKQGFSVPLDKWLLKDLNYLITKYLNKAIIEQYAIVRWEEVYRLTKRFIKGEHFLYNRLWALIMLHLWLKDHQH